MRGTTSFNQKAKALKGKIASGHGTGKITHSFYHEGKNMHMKRLNLSQVKKHLRSESRSKKEQESMRDE